MGSLLFSGCASLGSAMSPYSEKFSCKNDDHGQCIHPEKAYEDAAQGVASRSDPAVTNDKKLLRQHGQRTLPATKRGKSASADAYGTYRDSVYRELQELIEAPETPMLRPTRAVRTLILPYADRNRPDRLYMPRYVYSVLDTPSWVVGGYLVPPVSPASRAPVLEQVREIPGREPAPSAEPRP
ncbi:TraV family lipoprotein [Sphingopyxis panaciterrulae]|uniref:Conjugal transfer pilus assembly protein TraV n=1 Tax=Sphingopyxis panaciterrulae TaxID=462372 RepID=A0A7W9B6Y7_9SPHN|nr:TraV family lipoprotein [Sphingopyxis panaciterrulae]MBB5707395.1 conjugal transfer pilus assembly protein TraV [Sphingopyxis panaciterrulae]